MIGKLHGVIEEKEEDAVILDVRGVGYHVFVSSRLLADLPLGEEAKLYVEMIVREDAIQLYGFASRVEKDWFRTLTTVQRLGNKMALAILGAYPPSQIANAILAKDTAVFSRISGIGAKLAERIVIELKDKVLKMPTDDFMVAVNAEKTTDNPRKNLPKNGAIDEAISALVNLGYSRSEAYNSVQNATKEADTPTLDALIRRALKELAK